MSTTRVVDNVVSLRPRAPVENVHAALEARVQKYTLRALGAYRAAAVARAQGDAVGVSIAKGVAAQYLDKARIALTLIEES